MPSPFKFEIKDLTNDVISAIKLPLKFEGTNSKGKPLNGYRVDHIEMVIKAFAGLATGDYFIISVDSDDLNGDALADLVEIQKKDSVERVVKKFEILGTNGNSIEVEYPEVKPLDFKFKHAFCIQVNTWLNILAHGLAATRDTSFVMWGNYVHIPSDNYRKLDSGNTLN